MSTYTPPDQFLSPPLEALAQYSRKQNSSADSKSGYFSKGGSRGTPSRGNSPSDGPLTPSALAASIESSGLSESMSGHSTESIYLTPPQSQDDAGKPPYKARSESSASLNMSSVETDNSVRVKHNGRGKKRHSKHDNTARIKKYREYEQASKEYKCESRYESLGVVVKSTEIGEKAKRRREEDHVDCPSRLTSTTTANITSRRWSSVGIGANEVFERKSATADEVSHRLLHDNGRRSNSISSFLSDEDIMKAIRARLTFRKVSPTRPPTPATITLRRASGIPAGNDNGQLYESDDDMKLDQKQSPALTYLITTNDIDFITNLMQCGFDVRKSTLDLPEYSGEVTRKPSVTARGLLPQPSSSADLVITTKDIYQAPSATRFPFQDSKKSVSNTIVDRARKKFQVTSNNKVPEIIWEDTRLPISSKSSYETSSSSDGQGEEEEDSSTPRLLGKLSSSSGQTHLLHSGTLEVRQCLSSDDEDNSPKSRVARWVFKEPSKEIMQPLEASSQHNVFEEDPESPTGQGKQRMGSFARQFRPDVVSFPPLPARQSTTDWFSPLPNISMPTSINDSCLHDAGIDAQIGSGTRNLNEALVHVTEQKSPVDTTGNLRNSRRLDPESSPRHKSTKILHPQVFPRLGDSLKVGSAVGCSSGARRKSSTRSTRLKITDEGLEHRFQEGQANWVKPRKDSGWPAPRSPSPQELDSRKSSAASSPPVILAPGKFNKWLTKFEDIRPKPSKDSVPILPEIDHTGIFGAFTGTKISARNCESDCQESRLCGNTSLESRNPSTDWIG